MNFSIAGHQYSIELDSNINSILLYGSYARCENDELSDIDILIVNEKDNDKSYIITDSQGNALPEKWITVYSKTTIETMKKYTSLFLWHIKLESKFIYKRNLYLEKVLEDLPEYVNTYDDIYQYKTILKDIKDIVIDNNCTIFYELSLLASLIRNLSIAYCYLNGKKCFGRVIPVKHLLKDYPIFTIEDYEKLYVFRSTYNCYENKQITKINKSYIEYWISKTEQIINIVEVTND